MYCERSSHCPVRTSAVFDPRVMRECDHPAHDGFGHRSVHGTRRDEHQDVGLRAGGHVDRIVAHAKTADRQQVLRPRDARRRDARREHDHALGVAHLIGTNLRTMLGEGATLDLRLPVEDREPQVAVLRAAAGIKEVGRQRHDKIPRPICVAWRSFPLTLASYFQGLPSAVLHDSATTIRSGTGPP